MAKTIKKPKPRSTTLKAIEKLFGPVLPGSSEPESTISVFQEYSSPKKYKLIGLLGHQAEAKWHLHTQLPINPAKVKGHITGIVEEGKQHDPNRQQIAAQWLHEHNTALAQKAAKAQAVMVAKAAKEAMAARVGEYNAQLAIGEPIHVTLAIRIKVDAKGKISFLLPKKTGLRLPS